MTVGLDYPGISIVFFCYNIHGKFLMGKRSKNCRDEVGKWDIGSGKIKLHESPIETLNREVRKEYGTKILKYEFLGYRDVHRRLDKKRTHWIGLDFKVLIDGDKVKNGEPSKLDAIGWFTLKNLPQKYEMHSQLPKFLEKYKDRL